MRLLKVLVSLIGNMANQLPKNMALGTFGELLVELKLLSYGVQCAHPSTDTGNDLIASKSVETASNKFLTVQVRTRTEGKRWKIPDSNKSYNLLALVRVHLESLEEIDKNEIWLLKKLDILNKKSISAPKKGWRLSQSRIEELFCEFSQNNSWDLI